MGIDKERDYTVTKKIFMYINIFSSSGKKWMDLYTLLYPYMNEYVYIYERNQLQVSLSLTGFPVHTAMYNNKAKLGK